MSSFTAWDTTSESPRPGARHAQPLPTEKHLLEFFVERVPALTGDPFRVEVLLAMGRLFLVVAAPLTYSFTGGAGVISVLLMLGFGVYSVLLWTVLRRRSSASGHLPIVSHIVDIVWVAAITSATGGVASPLFGLFLFNLLEAAYRWGFQATVATLAVILCFLFPQTAILNASARASVGGAPLPAVPDGLMAARTACFTIGGLLLAYVARREKQQRDESAVIAKLAAGVRAMWWLSGASIAWVPTQRFKADC